MTHLYCDWSFPPTSGDLNFCSKILIMLMKSIKFTCKENKYNGDFGILHSICSKNKFLSGQTGAKSVWELCTSLQSPSVPNLSCTALPLLPHPATTASPPFCSGWQRSFKAPIFRSVFLPLLQLRTGFPAGWDTGCGFLQPSTKWSHH